MLLLLRLNRRDIMTGVQTTKWKLAQDFSINHPASHSLKMKLIYSYIYSFAAPVLSLGSGEEWKRQKTNT